jgi:hypothetical protein
VRYQHPGARQKWRYAWVDPAVVPDARAWLEARLGPLAGFEITIIRFTLKANDYTVGGFDFATPALTVRPGPGQEKFPWSTPSVEEISVTPAERAALEKLPSVIEGAVDLPGKFPWPTPKALEPFVTREEMEAFWALPLVDRLVPRACCASALAFENVES